MGFPVVAGLAKNHSRPLMKDELRVLLIETAPNQSVQETAYSCACNVALNVKQFMP
jgi:hypothetical protein